VRKIIRWWNGLKINNYSIFTILSLKNKRSVFLVFIYIKHKILKICVKTKPTQKHNYKNNDNKINFNFIQSTNYSRLSKIFENCCITSYSISSSFLFIIALAHPLKRSSIIFYLKYGYKRFNVESFLFGVAEKIT
jgi:hypothetical protein